MSVYRKRLDMLRVARPDLDKLPDHERVGLLLMYMPDLASFAEVVGELAPDHREWWLRVSAQAESQFIGGMTALFEEEMESQS